jgi:hypothetical protein
MTIAWRFPQRPGAKAPARAPVGIAPAEPVFEVEAASSDDNPVDAIDDEWAELIEDPTTARETQAAWEASQEGADLSMETAIRIIKLILMRVYEK